MHLLEIDEIKKIAKVMEEAHLPDKKFLVYYDPDLHEVIMAEKVDGAWVERKHINIEEDIE